MIRTSVMQEDKPATITCDSRGTLIHPNMAVVYNRAGRIEVGEIIKFSSNWRATRPGVDKTKWWKCYFEMKVKAESDSAISTIRNPNSFIMI